MENSNPASRCECYEFSIEIRVCVIHKPHTHTQNNTPIPCVSLYHFLSFLRFNSLSALVASSFVCSSKMYIFSEIWVRFFLHLVKYRFSCGIFLLQLTMMMMFRKNDEPVNHAMAKPNTNFLNECRTTAAYENHIGKTELSSKNKQWQPQYSDGVWKRMKKRNERRKRERERKGEKIAENDRYNGTMWRNELLNVIRVIWLSIYERNYGCVQKPLRNKKKERETVPTMEIANESQYIHIHE